jgi:hypothetical protein
VPRCGTGTYLITTTFTITTTSGGTDLIPVTGYIHLTNGGTISHTFNATPNATTSFHIVHRAHLIEGTQFTIGMSAALQVGDTAILNGNNNSHVHIVKLF